MNHSSDPLAFPYQRLLVKRWSQPQIDDLGFELRSGYVEEFWLPLIGPTTTLLIRRLDLELQRNGEAFWMDCADWSTRLGLGRKGGRNSPFWRSLERATRFSLAHFDDNCLQVRDVIPRLAAHQLDSLPNSLRAMHDEYC